MPVGPPVDPKVKAKHYPGPETFWLCFWNDGEFTKFHSSPSSVELSEVESDKVLHILDAYDHGEVIVFRVGPSFKFIPRRRLMALELPTFAWEVSIFW